MPATWREHSCVVICHGINANVIRKWLPLYRNQPATTLPAFVPLKAAPQRPSHIRTQNDAQPCANHSLEHCHKKHCFQPLRLQNH
jgi:transposase-like protein